ncbi:hypothetical protein KIH39_14275 [Telmatocola sphagniphila]|uniref:Carbohydrate-binding domain-containing protein n=1 Tax=Telmatocola sphagniphila TaxID=1123043 RepID=A0A8E6B1Q6_9BACT|nr:hypothetical protein [Telmatocola sphagniphila]QVL30031.1 hypothetical protein KIH39_14275 [Telmatocola sphagniphila]
MSLIPYRFLFRSMYACPYVAKMPLEDEDRLIDLPLKAKLDSLAEIDGEKKFADVRLGWNEMGLGLTVEVKGKSNYPIGEADRPRQSDGITLWIDTRGDRTGHRATRTCHQFHFLASGGSSTKDEAYFLQTKIHRALADAPLASAAEVPFRCRRIKTGYRMEAFLSSKVLTGFDPEQFPMLGVFYSIRDFELGDDNLSLDSNFPFSEDPSLWASLELVK